MFRRTLTVYDRAVYAGFLLLGLLGLRRHEMWRDELEIWLIARDSNSLFELFGNLSTEGHPALWYLLNYFVARITTDPVAMQLLHLAISAGLVFVVLAHAPFSRLQRWCFCLGYYGLYEFTVISRAYGLQLLLFFAVCALWPKRDRRPIVIAVLMFLMAHANLYGAIFAGCLVVLAWLDAQRSDALAGAPSRRLVVGLAIALAGILSGAGHVFWQSTRIGVAHLGVHQPGYDLEWLLRGFASISYGFVPLHDVTRLEFWNSNLLEALPARLSLGLGAAIGSALIALCLWALKPHPRLMMVFALGLVSMLCITLFLWFGQLRQHAQIFLLFLGCLWIADGTGERRASRSRPWLTVLLALQVVAGIYAYAVDWVRPFSNAATAASWIEQHDPEQETLVVGSRDYSVQPLTAYLKRSVFYPESGEFRTFLDWGPGRRMVGADEVLRRARELRKETSRPVLLVLSYGPGIYELGEGEMLSADEEIRFLARFTGAVVPDENYYVYRIDSPRRAGP